MEAEKAKQGNRKSLDRQKTLERSCKEQEQRLIDLEEPMSMLFSSVFVHRFVDTVYWIGARTIPYKYEYYSLG